MPIETFAHREAGIASNHVVHSFDFSDVAAMAEAEVSSADLGRVAFVNGIRQFFILTDEYSHTWQQLGALAAALEFADGEARSASIPSGIGQLGWQLDTGQLYTWLGIVRGWQRIDTPPNTVPDLTTLRAGGRAQRMMYVDSVRDWYLYDPLSEALDDAITVVTPDAFMGRWHRIGIAHPTWALQTAWHIDPAAGIDEATGADAGAPIKTWRELTRRLGNPYTARSSITVNLLGNLPTADPLIWDVIVANSGRVVVQGVPTAQYTGALTAVQSLSAATNAETQATAGWTVSAELQRLVFAAARGFAFVAKDLGSGNARLSNWVGINEVAGNTTGLTNSAAVTGDTVTTYTLPTVAGLHLSVRGTAGSTSPFILQKVEFTGAAGTGRIFSGNSQMQLQNCKITGALRIGAGKVVFNNVHCGSTALVVDYSAFILQCAGLVTTTAYDASGARPQSYLDFRNHVLFQGAGLGVNAGGLATHQDVWFCDVTGDAIIISANSLYRANGLICGSNVSGYALALGGGARGVYTALGGMKLAATAGDLSLAGVGTAHAFDAATGLYISPARTCSFVNLLATVATGGFGGRIVDPLTGCNFVLGT